jgi:hypothetical protein
MHVIKRSKSFNAAEYENSIAPADTGATFAKTLSLKIRICSVGRCFSPNYVQLQPGSLLYSEDGCRAVQSVHKSSDSDSSIFKPPTPS